MAKERVPCKVLVIGEEREGFSAVQGEVVYIADGKHRWGREEKPPRFHVISVDLSKEEKRDLLLPGFWKWDFGRNNFVSRVEEGLDWDSEQVFGENDTPQSGRNLGEVSLLVSNGKSNKPEEALLCPFFDRAGDRLDFSFSTWERFLRQIQLVEHRLRKYEKGRGNDLRLLRKALYFVGFYGIDWIGSVVVEARGKENSKRKEVLNFFSDKEVSDWIANLWDVRN